MSDDILRFFAHTLPPPAPRESWEPLADHCKLVAEGDGDTFPGAAGFADEFGAAAWGKLAGYWHDLGKYSLAFQKYLVQSTAADAGHRSELRGSVDHSTAGAQHAASMGHPGRLLAYVIAGHHAGLPDAVGEGACLEARLRKPIESFDAAPPELLHLSLPSRLPINPPNDRRGTAFSVAFFVRMLFSCLVDADFLATERFMKPENSRQRPSNKSKLSDLLSQVTGFLDAKEATSPVTEVNMTRSRVRRECIAKSDNPPGFFSLNVPTGGGKTLASLEFALSHAVHHGKRRVVYGIPFTTIIEQSVNAFREALGEHAGAVLEYHGALDQADPFNQSITSRLAAENFDASVVVTTNVQLFESLFASKPARCRKLHRLVNSVIVLDEVQAIPAKLLQPSLAALSELVTNYGVSVVLCTATQPAFEYRSDFPIGLKNVLPLVDNPVSLHQALRRTSIERLGKLSNEELARRLQTEHQALCIVNSRGHAERVFRLLNDADAFHLSAAMCPQHRLDTLRRIRRRLSKGRPCRVISTQLIEAGVDLDFPCVYRAEAGLDSIAQANGRCNREGHLGVGADCQGRLILFEYDEKENRPPPFVTLAAASFREIAPDYEADLLSPDAVSGYFRLRYWQQGEDNGRGWDRSRGGESVMECFGSTDCNPLNHQFREASSRYRLIEDGQIQIVVGYRRRGRQLVERLKRMPEDVSPSELRHFDRDAQRYTVGVWSHQLKKLLESQVLVEYHDRYCLVNAKVYDLKLGVVPGPMGIDPDSLIQ